MRRLLLLLVCLSWPTAAIAQDRCQLAALQARVEVERLPLPERAQAIRQRFAERPELVCGLFDAKPVSGPAEVPEGCKKAELDRCPIEGGLTVADRAKKDADPDHYLWAQYIAAKLRAAGKLSPAHQRLLEIWILSATQGPQAR